MHSQLIPANSYSHLTQACFSGQILNANEVAAEAQTICGGNLNGITPTKAQLHWSIGILKAQRSERAPFGQTLQADDKQAEGLPGNCYL